MSDQDALTRATLLLVHDDSDLLDALTRIFEARGCEVAIAATEYAAVSRLSSGREFHAVVAGWDAGRGVARALYEWILNNRYELRDLFVFISLVPPLDFDDLVQGQGLLLHAYDFDEIVRTTEATIQRAFDRASAELPASAIDWMDADRPSLLLIDDDPLQLAIMKALLREMGFAVTAAESCREATADLEHGDFDVILCDWYIAGCSGADMYEWIVAHRPHLATRCVFMSGSTLRPKRSRGIPPRPFVPKGQDSTQLVQELRAVATQVREARRSAASAAVISQAAAQPALD